MTKDEVVVAVWTTRPKYSSADREYRLVQQDVPYQPRHFYVETISYADGMITWVITDADEAVHALGAYVREQQL